MQKHPLKESFTEKIPNQDDRLRNICDHCGFIDYSNPKIVTGSVAVKENRFLLCRRAIEPRKGFWTLPAGFLENGEDVASGALREAREEANATLNIEGLLGVYSVPRISQVQIFFRARLIGGVSAGPESLEVGLFSWDDIPWKDIAFPTVELALNDYRAGRGDNLRVMPSQPLPGV
jgi:ADP-ribose pyrophosphatase YjhB (NUDIX family)